jgi:DNA-binding transcriptional MerR regulator
VPAPATQQAYSREDVRRQLGVSKRQLESWEKQNLLPSGGSFSFSDILALRTLVGLRKSNVSAVQIRKAVHAVRKHFREFENPLTEVKIYSQGKKIEVQFAGNKKMEAISGQLILNFDQAEISKLLSFPGQVEESEASRKMKSRREAEHWFEKGLDLEQTGAPAEEVIAAYQKAAEIDPTSAGALVNLGTVYFNAGIGSRPSNIIARPWGWIRNTLWRISISAISTTSAATAGRTESLSRPPSGFIPAMPTPITTSRCCINPWASR